MQKRFQILALSGGGYKGLFTANIIARIEKQIGGPIANKFDLIAGTSIGGILAIALALEIPAQEMVDIFMNYGEQIFTKKRFSWWGIPRDKYSNKALKDILKEKFKDKTIGDLKHRLIIPTINYTKGSLQIFKTKHHHSFISDSEKKLLDVALMTSAAPTYFPIYRHNCGNFVDGGLVANHPGFFACIEAQKFMNIPISKIHQLHIGTLNGRATSEKTPSGFIRWREKLIELIFSVQEQSTDQILRFILNKNYFSINYEPTDSQNKSIGLDKVTKKSKDILNRCSEIAIQENLGKEEFREFLKHSKQQFTPEI